MTRGGQRLRRNNAKSARRKAAVATKRMANPTPNSLTKSIGFAAKLPIAYCVMTEDLLGTGLGEVILARALPSGKLGCAFVLIDTYCLGAKDAFYRELPRGEFHSHIQAQPQGRAFTEIDPSFARKLINDAVAYAAGLGIDAHKDFAAVEEIFGSVDASKCGETFSFGKNGKPLYIPGPLDTPDRIAIVGEILRSLGSEHEEKIAKRPWWKFW